MRLWDLAAAATAAATPIAAGAGATATSPAAALLPPGLAPPPPRASDSRVMEDTGEMREMRWSPREETELKRLHDANDRYERNALAFGKLRWEGGDALRSWFRELHKAEQVHRHRHR